MEEVKARTTGQVSNWLGSFLLLWLHSFRLDIQKSISINFFMIMMKLYLHIHSLKQHALTSTDNMTTTPFQK